jgi:hypothetical protein
LKPIPLFLAAWASAGVGAVIGSILGHGAGKTGLFTGAILGGLLGIVIAVGAGTKLKWLSSEDRAGALVGGMLGFGVAAPIAVTHLHTPVTPLLICGLAGVGLLVGVWVVRLWRGRA